MGVYVCAYAFLCVCVCSLQDTIGGATFIYHHLIFVHVEHICHCSVKPVTMVRASAVGGNASALTEIADIDFSSTVRRCKKALLGIQLSCAELNATVRLLHLN